MNVLTSRRRAVVGAGVSRWMAHAGRLLRFFRRDAAAVLGLVCSAVVLATAAVGPALVHHDPIAVAMDQRLLPPQGRFWFGTDELGRDIFTRIVFGARTSVLAAAAIIVATAAIGAAVGGVAGYYGGLIDTVSMRTVDLLMAFPYLILALAISFALGPGLFSTGVALTAVWWPSYARLVRGLVLVLRHHQFVEAARAMGASSARIIRLHVLPHCVPALTVRVTTDLGFVIIAGASLSFIGLGPQPPSPDWGAMISNARSYVMSAWWYGVFPGLALFIAAMGFALMGDVLQDALDPRVRGRS